MKFVLPCVAAAAILVLVLFRGHFKPTQGDDQGTTTAAQLSAAPAAVAEGALGPATSGGVDGPPRRHGTWNVTAQLSLPGVTRQPPPIAYTRCVSREEAEDPARLLPLGGELNSGRGNAAEREAAEKEEPKARDPRMICQTSDQKVDGPRVTWATTCEGPSTTPLRGVGDFVYGYNSYRGTMTVMTTRNGEPATMTTSYSATRVGDCVK
jgi:hypothetical protein